MLAETRREYLLELITRQGSRPWTSWCEVLRVSESTVRRDLEALDLAGSVKRTHGGAVYAGEVRSMPAFDERTGNGGRGEAGDRPGGRGPDRGRRHGPARRRHDHARGRPGAGRPARPGRDQQPADRAASGVEPADRPDPDRRVCLPADGRGARAAGDCRRCRAIRVRKAILGAGGIVAEGIYNSNLLLVETERQMMACGQEVMIVADHTKFGRLALARLCGLDEVDQLVTDSGLADEYRAILEAAGVTVHVAPVEWSRTNGSRSPDRRTATVEDRGMSTLVAHRRDQVENLVRSILQKQLAGTGAARQRPRQAQVYRPNVVVNISARHCHLTQADVDVLFGPGYQLTPMKRLYQDTDFAANETVAVVGPAAADDPRRADPRPLPQVQPGRAGVHRRDQPGDRRAGAALGRHRGDARLPPDRPQGEPGAAQQGVIRAERHVHMGPKDAEYYGVKHLDRMNMRVESPARRRSRACWCGPIPTGSSRCTSTPTRPTAATCRTRPGSP